MTIFPFKIFLNSELLETYFSSKFNCVCFYYAQFVCVQECRTATYFSMDVNTTPRNSSHYQVNTELELPRKDLSCVDGSEIINLFPANFSFLSSR